MLVEILTSGKMIPRLTSKARYITNILLITLAVCAAVYGVTYAYLLHHLVNLVCAWFVAMHFSGSDISLQRISQMLEGGVGDDGEYRGGKKMP